MITKSVGQFFLLLTSCSLILTACGKQPDSSATLLTEIKSDISKKDYSAAEKKAQNLIEDLEIKKQEDKTTIEALSLIAEAQGQQRNFDQAEKNLLTAYEFSQRINGPDHEDTGALAAKLGSVYFARQDFETSQEYWQKALTVVKKSKNPDENKEVEAISGVIAASCAKGACTDNEALIKRLLEVRRKKLGNNDPFTVIAINLLAELYDHKKNFAAARPLYFEVYTIAKENNGLNLPAAMINLARIERHDKHYKEARKLLEEAMALELADKTYGSMVHPNLCATLDSFVYLYKDQGNWNQALQYSSKALALREKTMGKEHPQIPPYYRAHAELLRKVQRNTEAKALEDRAKKIEFSKK
ncbi:MAG: tetratricopeptide repeat protein [Candidatus Obscuribacterales bacterium]|nr:tetratricopeptide repeat protein [Candidatus Obscuribacterales bacterium]